MSSAPAQAPSRELSNYYRWHSRIYDLTRWAFLFGRHEIIRRAVRTTASPERILEVGCGTGKNLVALARAFPEAEITGLDLSSDMLDRARPKLAGFGERVRLLHRRYDAPVADGKKFDLVLFSYSLSMINPGYEGVLDLCREDLAPGGCVAVVDFHQSRAAWFRRWMGVNHVRMEGHLLEAFRARFEPRSSEISSAYGGLWQYLLYLGHIRP
ncbi:MAG: methyltransferase domain-containing protein [Verrucomicrobiae bacterium]|nr:methyltransferase domain-containing protein [Verrucomicrobiae bacterium]